MGTTYELIKQIENDMSFTVLLKKGVIPLTVMDKKVYYEYYIQDLQTTGNTWQSVINTSEEYNVSQMTVRRAIKFMEK